LRRKKRAALEKRNVGKARDEYVLAASAAKERTAIEKVG
jgi:hypothetical protein